MLTPSHIAAGYLLTEAKLGKSRDLKLTPGQLRALFAYGIICANLPDLNMLWCQDFGIHHNDIFHYPAFWLAVYLLLMRSRLVAGSRRNRLLLDLMGIQLLAHLVMDMFGIRIGIHPFWPLSRTEVSITPLAKGVSQSEAWPYYLQGWVLPLEIIIWLITVFVLLRKRLAPQRQADST